MIIYYLLVLAAVALLALQFTVSKAFQLRYGSAIYTSLLYSAITGAACAVIFLIASLVSGAPFALYPFSLVCALAVALLCTAYNILGFKIVAMGPMALYMMFLMLGGMLLPYFFGILCLGEKPTAARIIGVVLLIAAMILPTLDGRGNDGQTQKKTPAAFWLLCAAVFVMNGCVSIASKIHSIHDAASRVTDVQFVVLANGITFVLAALVLLVAAASGKMKENPLRPVSAADAGASDSQKPLTKEDSQKPLTKSKRSNVWLALLFGALGAACSGVSYYFQLVGAGKLDASVLYPMVTGGSIVLSAVAARIFFKEKPAKWALFGLILAFAATFLFVDWSAICQSL